jgi:methylase of polypeptide subunit release factors
LPALSYLTNLTYNKKTHDTNHLKTNTTERKDKTMFYRIAILAQDEPCLKWKSTPLSSLDVLFTFLRLYRAIPQDRLRIFQAASCEEMETMFVQENNGQAVNSLTPDQFLSGKRILTSEKTFLPEQKPEQQVTEQRGSVLEQRRTALEMGTGSDHDLPYTFTLPSSVPQLLKWTRLLVNVQQGELLP